MSDLLQRQKTGLSSLVPGDGSPSGNTALRGEANVIAHHAMSAAHSEPIGEGILAMTYKAG